MIGLLLIAGAAIGYWAWKTRDAQMLRFGDVAAVVAALIALRLLTRGEFVPGIAALAGAGWWAWFRKQDSATVAMSRSEAARLLDVPPSASREEIKAAHRRLIARVHPDAGGSADLTRQVNAARDALLAGFR